MSDTSMLENPNLTSEEILGPPRIDLLGLGLISFLALVVGLLVGIGVFMLVYFTFGEFILHSGASSGFISIFAFICMTIGNIIYCWGLSNIFPHIYSRTRTLSIQVTVFSILLYIAMSCVYFFIGALYPSTTILLGVYAIHVLLNAFGLLLLVGILSQYRYSLLTLYSSMISLVLSGVTIFWIYTVFSASAKVLFLFIGLASTVYLIVTVFHFGIGWLYIQLYMLSGADPLGDVMGRIESEEKALEQFAEKSLFSKK